MAQASAKPKRKKLKLLFIGLAVIVAAALGFFALDMMGVFTKYDTYQYVRADAQPLTGQDLKTIETVLSARVADMHPGGRGYGMPKMKLRGGVLEAKVVPHQVDRQVMHVTMSTGKFRLLDAQGGQAAGPEDITAITKEFNGQTNQISVTLTDEAMQRIRAEFANKTSAYSLELDGRPVQSLYRISAKTSGNSIAIADGYFGITDAIIAASRHPLGIRLEDVNPPEPERGQDSASARHMPDTASSMPPLAAPADKPQLAEGERLYNGSGKLQYSESVAVSFVLTADKSEIRDLSITIINLEYSTTSGNSHITRRVGSSTTKLSGNVPVQNGQVDARFGAGNRLTLSGVGRDEATGVLQFSHTFHDTPSVTVDLGSTPLTLRVEKQ